MKAPNEVVIPREYALFRLDAQGYWRNADGKFKNKKIIDYFHQAIGRDSGGYFVSQDKGGIIEKVYFPYEDTAIFVFDVLFDPEVTTEVTTEVVPAIALVLNTGKRMPLNPEQLFIQNDNLYIQTDGETIKFSERALMKISARFEETEDQLQIRLGDTLYPIPQY